MPRWRRWPRTSPRISTGARSPRAPTRSATARASSSAGIASASRRRRLVLASLVGGLSVSIVQTRRAKAAAAAARSSRRDAPSGSRAFWSRSSSRPIRPGRWGPRCRPGRSSTRASSGSRPSCATSPRCAPSSTTPWRGSRAAWGCSTRGSRAPSSPPRSGRAFSAPRSREHAQSLVTRGQRAARPGARRGGGQAVRRGGAAFRGRGRSALGRLRAGAFGPSRDAHAVGRHRRARWPTSAAPMRSPPPTLGETDAKTLEHLSNIAVLETEAGTFAEAVRIFRQILDGARAGRGRRLAEGARGRAQPRDGARHRPARAPRRFAYFERVVAGRRRIYGDAASGARRSPGHHEPAAVARGTQRGGARRARRGARDLRAARPPGARLGRQLQRASCSPTSGVSPRPRGRSSARRRDSRRTWARARS